MQAFDLSTDNKLVFSTLVHRAHHSWFPRRIFIHLTREQIFIFKPFSMSFGPREDGGVSGSCSHMISSLHDTALTFVDCMVIYVHREWFLEVFLSPSRGVQESIQFWPSALSHAHRLSSWFSTFFDHIMHYRWWDLQRFCNFTLRNVFLKLFHNF